MKGIITFGLAAGLCCGLSQPALPQAKGKATPALVLDAGPSAADPLAPRQHDGQTPLAPGAPATLPDSGSGEAGPVVIGARQQLAGMPLPRAHGDREDQAALVAFYAAMQRPVWTNEAGFTARAKQAISEIAKADDWGLKASAFDLPVLADGTPSPEALVDAEVKLGLAVLRYARHARGGRLDPSSISRKFDQRPGVYDPRSVLLALLSTEDAAGYLRSLHPKHDQFGRLQKALVAARSDMQAGVASANNIRLLLANMERWRWMPDDLGDFYVWDSIPEQLTRVVDKDRVVLSEKIVVGRPSTPTPIFSADMQFIIFHPSWGVPTGMKIQELWPQLRNTGGGWFSSNPLASAVLASHGLQVSRGGQPVDPDAINWSKVDINSFDFVQPPGPRNVLGIVKFRFPNRHDVYMHDTPERHLFGGAVRAFSHGCMRVQNPIHLAEVLLAHDKGWSAADVREYVKRGGEIKLTAAIPVHITYFTATVADDGKVSHFADLYGLDSRVIAALEGQHDYSTSRAGGISEKDKTVRQRAHAKSRAPRNATTPPPTNPFAAIFGN